ncbi:hypothetical protein [Cryobacterium zongtaii]|uniref:hypothetical protein n=1 Tax=Cryobacterium zongtaii TaxID=1259217 RepID=UPI001056E312|nr:hypothetical protein [Cryobacterium zongtaii]
MSDMSPHERRNAFRSLLVSTVEDDVADGASHRFSVKWALTGLTVIGALIGCIAVANTVMGSDQTPPIVAIQDPGQAAQEPVDEVQVRNPADLVEDADLVATGTVIGIEEVQAPAGIPQPYGIVTTFTLVLSNVEVMQGTAALAPDGYLRIAVPGFTTSAGGQSIEQYLRVVPEGSDAVAFLERGWAGNGGMKNMNPGDESGNVVPLYIPTTSQSLAIQKVGAQTVTWPLADVSRKGTLRDTLPGGDLVPFPGN